MTSMPSKRFHMTLEEARLRIFLVWGIAVILYIAVFEAAPFVRGKWVISHSQAHTGLMKILESVR
jgi:hypothetical protein